MGLRILHISDIHFRDYKDHQVLNLDGDIQNEIEIDIETHVLKHGKIDIILLGGDIAFSGQESEYKVADTWIKNICKISGCRDEDVFCVPGNHDIDRTKIDPMLKDIHKIFKGLQNRREIDIKIGDYLLKPSSTTSLLLPLSNYFQFAEKYGCVPAAGNSLYWEKDVSLGNLILRIRGVNSAIVSNDTDHQQNSRLVLGSHQSSLSRNRGVINMILCHHPPDWLIDGEDVHNDLKPRARVHLYGHKHKFGAELINNDCVVLSAGAMQPSRAESGWEPRYNIIELNTIPMADKPTLNVRLYKRVWKKSSKSFVPDFESAGDEYIEYPMALSDIEVSTNIVHKKGSGSDNTLEHLKIVPMVEPIINLTMPDPKRKLAYLFLGLPYHIKVIIAAKLKLIDDSDRNLPESQKTQLYFKRATEQGILSTLWEEVSAVTDVDTQNPFITKS